MVQSSGVSDTPPEDAILDGCDLDFVVEDQLTEDGEQTDALVLFADVWDNSSAIEDRRRELIEWAAATQVNPDV